MDELEKYHDQLNEKAPFDHNDELSRFLSKSGAMLPPKSKSKETIWLEIEEQIDSPTPGKSRILSPLMIWSIAASVCLIATLSVFFTLQWTKPVVVQSIAGNTLRHILPDGSVVTLNANSSISYKRRWQRSLSLEGEAFFEVTKGATFSVSTTTGTVTVLGTSFNVYARDRAFEVACKTGKVQVEIPQLTLKEQLLPGQLIAFRSDTIQHASRAPELMDRWKEGEFYFEAQPLDFVVSELQRQFDVDIEVVVSKEKVFSGYFTNKDLKKALDMVCLPLNLTYRKSGRRSIIITDEKNLSE